MSLLEDLIRDHSDDPRSFLWNGAINLVDRDIISEHRWYDRYRLVYERDGEFVAVEYNEGSTELQEDTEPNATFYVVQPVEVSVTKYERVADL